MNRLKRFTALVICASLIGGGCSMMNSADEEKDYEIVDGEIVISDKENERLEKRGEAYRKENYVPVQEYVGEGFTLESDRGTAELAEKHKDEVEQAVQKFFLEQYKTEVKVHNIVGTTDAASIFVESIGEPHFYTLAIIPLDVKSKEVKFDEVWSLEGEVEMAIITGIFAMIYEEEFAVLDKYLEGIVQEYPVVGKKIEAIANVGANKHATPYYRLNADLMFFQEIYDAYLENPKRSIEDWKELSQSIDYEPEDFTITIELFMSEAGMAPDEKLIDKIVSDIKEMKQLPRARFTVYINDNYIDKTNGRGTKENTIERGNPELIIKE